VKAATTGASRIILIGGVPVPLTFEAINFDAMAKKVGSMVGHITYFGSVEMPRELSQWQTQDMHRKRPAVKRRRWRARKTRALTLIRPHSRAEVLRSRAYQAGLRRRIRSKRKRPSEAVIAVRLRHSTRPILREILYAQFVDRLTRALHETVNWT
jgi:hypothetical protein